MNILIADDDPVSRRLLEGTLTRLGHAATVVGDGSAALEVLLNPNGPRLAILDWMMPGMDGLAVCRAARIRAQRYIYILLLTARDRREDLVTAFDAEADDFLTKPFDVLELRARLRSGARVLELQERLLETQAALELRVTHDALTGVWSRGRIRDQLKIDLERARRERQPIAVALADLDHFKLVNDTHGHAAGDDMLKEAARRMRSVVRVYESIGRYGGEEFLFILPGCDQETARQVTARVREAVASAPVTTRGAVIPLSVSIGLAWTATPPEDLNALIVAADDALYRAKAAGRNVVSE